MRTRIQINSEDQVFGTVTGTVIIVVGMKRAIGDHAAIEFAIQKRELQSA